LINYVYYYYLLLLLLFIIIIIIIYYVIILCILYIIYFILFIIIIIYFLIGTNLDNVIDVNGSVILESILILGNSLLIGRGDSNGNL